MTYISSIKMACILEPAYNGTAADRNFSVAGRFFVIQVLEI
jgi:hypothetical protein